MRNGGRGKRDDEHEFNIAPKVPGIECPDGGKCDWQKGPELEEAFGYLSGFQSHMNVKSNLKDSYASDEQRRIVESFKATQPVPETPAVSKPQAPGPQIDRSEGPKISL